MIEPHLFIFAFQNYIYKYTQHRATGGSWSITTTVVKICYRHSPNEHVKRLNPIRSLGHINDHINPITLFSVHVNNTFRFVNQNEFIPMEAKSVHVNVAIDTLHKEGKP